MILSRLRWWALPTSVSYVLAAVMGEFLLHERVSTERWIGIGLIGLGVSLVVRTVPRHRAGAAQIRRSALRGGAVKWSAASR